jgi:hypothetical protein
MSKMKFTLRSNGKVVGEYQGFQSIRTKPKGPLEGLVVIAWFEGEPNLWQIENGAGLEQLKKYYTDDWGPTRVKEMGFDVLAPVVGHHDIEFVSPDHWHVTPEALGILRRDPEEESDKDEESE